MIKESLPQNVTDKLNDWFSGYEYTVLHFWEIKEFETWHIVVKCEDELVFVRIFKNVFNSELCLSVDGTTKEWEKI